MSRSLTRHQGISDEHDRYRVWVTIWAIGLVARGAMSWRGSSAGTCTYLQWIDKKTYSFAGLGSHILCIWKSRNCGQYWPKKCGRTHMAHQNAHTCGSLYLITCLLTVHFLYLVQVWISQVFVELLISQWYTLTTQSCKNASEIFISIFNYAL